MDLSTIILMALCAGALALPAGGLVIAATKQAGRWLDKGHTLTVQLPPKSERGHE